MPEGLPPFWLLGRPWLDGSDRYAEFTRRLRAAFAARSPGEDLLACVASALATPESRLWVEKTPRHTLRVPEIAATYPQARFVHIVRDPRAALASIDELNRERSFTATPTAAVELAETLRLARSNAQHFGDRYVVLHYERLVADPRREMGRVADALGLSWTDELVRPSLTANSSSPERRVEGVIHTMSTDRGKDLRGWPAALVATYAAAPARALGYDVAPAGPLRRLAVKSWLSVCYRARARLRRTARPQSRPS
jgi:hypothetical protein